MAIVPMTDVPATVERIDAIADIEMKRREMQKEAGLAAGVAAEIVAERATESGQEQGPQDHGPGRWPVIFRVSVTDAASFVTVMAGYAVASLISRSGSK